MAQLTLIQTSDFHNHIDLAMAGRLGNLRVEEDALLLDCGDAIWAGNVFVRPGSEQAIARMNEAGYDAMAVGNREYFFRAGGMVRKTAGASFAVLSANLLPKSRGSGHIKRWTVIESAAGDSVGVFGLSPVMIKPGSWPEFFSNMRFISHRQATREAVVALADNCKWIVCLSHIGIERDHEIAVDFPEIDIILGGHSHERSEGLIHASGVPISHIGPYGEHAAIIRSLGDRPDTGFEREIVPLR